MSRSFAAAVAGRIARVPTLLYRWRLGWLLDHRFVLLVHTGRRSGLERRTVLEAISYRADSGAVVVMSGLGRKSDWYRNIQAHPAQLVVIGRREFVPVWRELTEDEAVAALADYERRNRIATPVVRWVLSRLVGWRYDGSEASRRRLVADRPLIRFSPRP